MKLRLAGARPLLVGTVVALVAAAVLAAYLQYRFAQEQRRQTELVLQQVCERTASLLAARLQSMFESAVPQTIERLDHLAFLEYRIGELAPALEEGLRRFGYIDRFFVWSHHAPAGYRDQALFFRPSWQEPANDVLTLGAPGQPQRGLIADWDQGREILELAQEYEKLKRYFAVVDLSLAGRRQQIVIHYQWEGPGPEGRYGIVGYTVDLSKVRTAMVRGLIGEEFERTAAADREAPQLRLAVFDDREELVYGSPVASNGRAASADLRMLFFPISLDAWSSGLPELRPWRLVVSVASLPAWDDSHGYGVFAVLISLIFIALFCAVAVSRQSSRLSRMHADFIANVSHQLKTPLSLLSAASETLRLQRVRNPDKVKEYAEVVQDQTDRLAGLVEQILLFSRTQGAGGGRAQEPIDLADPVKNAVERFKVAAANFGTPLEFRRPAESLIVEGDAQGLEEVFANLIDNAIKYGNGCNQVTVAMSREDSRAIVAVRDRGIGIDARDLSRIFEKFFRGRDDRLSRQPGFGLGLSIVHEIVRSHGGDVAVESRAGVGSEFRVVLPLSSRH